MAKKNKDAPVDIDIVFKPSDKQREIVEYCELGNGIQIVAVATGRQVGKSTIAILIATKWFLENDNFSVGFFLPIYKQCKNLFDRLLIALKSLIDAKLVVVNKSDMSFTSNSGSKIQFYGSDTDTMRGNTFDALIVDEANFIRDDIWQAAILATIGAALSERNEDGEVGFSGKVLMLSTPKAKNWFYGYVMNESGNKRHKSVRFTSEEGGVLAPEIIAEFKNQLPEAIFRNEYMGEFLDSGAGLFKYVECIKNVDCKNGVIAGLDVAAVNDYMCLTIQNKQGNVIFQDRWKGAAYAVLLAVVAEKLKEYGDPLCHVEINGVGKVPFQILRDMGCRVKEWVTSNSSKNEMILQLSVDFCAKNITIPDNDYAKDELDNFTVEWKKGKPIYGGSNGFHDDTVMSLAISNYNRKRTVKSKPTLIKSKRRRSL